MGTVTVRLYEELNDYLPEPMRKQAFPLALHSKVKVKDVLAALRVPAEEVDLILVNGISVPWSRTLQPEDRVSVYPVFERFDIRSVACLRSLPLRRTRFLAFEPGLQPFVRLMRSLGFDVLWNRSHPALCEGQVPPRILVHTTRARFPEVPRKLRLPSAPATHQVRHAVSELQIEASLQPLSRCLHCNRPLSVFRPGRALCQVALAPCRMCGHRPWSRREALAALSLARTFTKAAAAGRTPAAP